MADNDYAILVGISRYADKSLHELSGPLRDVELMRQWLEDPERGNVPPTNVHCVVTDESKPPPESGLPPVLDDFLKVFKGILLSPDESQVIRRPASRLYLYFSGHGFCERMTASAQAALYVANCTRVVNLNISGTSYAQWVRDHGAFGEIVLVMDCCRDAELYKLALPVVLRQSGDTSLARGIKLFELYATSRGGKAQERPINERGGNVHGLLTHALIKALDHAAPKSQAVLSRDLKGYIHENWDLICGTEPMDPPDILTPPNGEMSFSRREARETQQGFKLLTVQPGAELRIRSGMKLELIAKLKIADEEVHVTRENREFEVAVVASRFAISLPNGYCLVTGGVNEANFQVGAADVEL